MKLSRVVAWLAVGWLVALRLRIGGALPVSWFALLLPLYLVPGLGTGGAVYLVACRIAAAGLRIDDWRQRRHARRMDEGLLRFIRTHVNKGGSR